MRLDSLGLSLRFGLRGGLAVAALVSACHSGRESSVVAPDPGQAPTPSAECDVHKAAIVARFTEAARCTADSDCTTMLPGCPFGCGRAINKAADITPITSDIAEYNQSCNRCMYRCRPIEEPPVCRAGLCSLGAAPP